MKTYMIFLIVCFLFFLWIPVSTTESKEDESVHKELDGTLKGFTMTLLDGDTKKKAVINGSVARILRGGLIDVLDVVARIYNPGGNGCDVLIHSSRGVYNKARNIVDTDQFVRINYGNMVVTGTGLHWEPDMAKLEMYKNVRIEYITERRQEDVNEDNTHEPLIADNSEDVVTVITGEGKGDMDYKTEPIVIMRRNVRIRDRDVNIKAHLAKAFFDKETQKLNKVEVYGNVKIKQPKRESLCKKAIYFVGEDKAVLTGKPKIVKGLDLYAAEKITIYDKGERVIFEPKAELVIFASPENASTFGASTEHEKT